MFTASQHAAGLGTLTGGVLSAGSLGPDVPNRQVHACSDLCMHFLGHRNSSAPCQANLEKRTLLVLGSLASQGGGHAMPCAVSFRVNTVHSFARVVLDTGVSVGCFMRTLLGGKQLGCQLCAGWCCYNKCGNVMFPQA